MQSYTRHKLKEDKFAQVTKETVSWAAEHRSNLVAAITMIGIVLAAAAGLFGYANSQHQKASDELAKAMRIYAAPIRSSEQPIPPGVLSFASSKERAQAASKEFARVAASFGGNSHVFGFVNRHAPAEIAAYLAGVTAMEAGENVLAERHLRNAAQDNRHKDTAALAKLALASLYQATNRKADAITIYKDLIDHATDAVPKSSAQIQLGQIYEDQQPAEALRTYEQVRKDDPQGIGARLADERINALKQKSP